MCRFHKNEVCFLGYVSSQVVKMEDEWIEAVKNWPELTSIRDIQVFIGFANFYWCFILSFSRIAVSLTSLLKISELSKLGPKAFRADDDEIIVDSGNRANEMVVNLSKNEKISNFYWRFIRSFSRIAALLISLLKTIGLSKLASKAFRADDDEVVGGGGNRVDETVVDSSKSKNEKSKKLTCMPNIRATGEPNFLTSNAKKAFN